MELITGKVYDLGAYHITIDQILGKGGMSIVYEGWYQDDLGMKHRVILKECMPAYLRLYRDETGKIDLTDEQVVAFQTEKEAFIQSYKNNVIMQGMDPVANSTVAAHELLYGNGTVYMMTQYHTGISYNQVKEETLEEILKTILAVCRAVRGYHDQGYLHLDLKPANVLKLPETDELVMLFDFGSVVQKASLHEGKIRDLSYSREWAAPELEGGRHRRICEATDVYAIGMMLWNRITGRMLTKEELMNLKTLDFVTGNPLFKSCPPRLIRLLGEILRRALNLAVGKRYGTIALLEEAIRPLLEDAREDCMYIQPHFTYDDQFFVGRTNEIDRVKQMLDAHHMVFIHGFGGIGKSSLAKKYAHVMRGYYDAIVMIQYVSDLQSAIISDYELPIAHFERAAEESAEAYYRRKMNKLVELANERTLLIIDNFDTEEDAYLEELIHCGAKIILTTRTDFSDYNFPQVDVKPLEQIEEVEAIFYHYNKEDYTDDERLDIRRIIELVQRHTMTVELIAKLMRVSGLVPRVLYEQLCEAEGIVNVGEEDVRQKKDRKLNKMSILRHLKVVFNLSRLGEAQRELLRNLCLLSIVKINKALFVDWLQLQDEAPISDLIERGWVQYDKQGDKISLHQIVTDLAYEEEKPEARSCSLLTNQMAELALVKDCVSQNEKQQKLKVCQIFKKRIRGNTLDLAQFYSNLGESMLGKNLDEARDCIDCGSAIIEDLKEVCSRQGSELASLEGTYLLRWMEKNCWEEELEMDDLLRQVIHHYNEGLRRGGEGNSEEDCMRLAEQCIQMGKKLIYFMQSFIFLEDYMTEMLQTYTRMLFNKAVVLADTNPSQDIKRYQKICMAASDFFSPHDYTLMDCGGNDEELFLLYKQKAKAYDPPKKEGVIDCDAYALNSLAFGRAAFSKGRYEEALSWYQKALEEEEGSWLQEEVYQELIKVSLRQGNLIQAKEYGHLLMAYDREYDMSLIYTYYFLGKQMEEHDYKEEAIGWYKQVLELARLETSKQDYNKGVLEKGIQGTLELSLLENEDYILEAIELYEQYFEGQSQGCCYFGAVFEVYEGYLRGRGDKLRACQYGLKAMEAYESAYEMEALGSYCKKMIEYWEEIVEGAEETLCFAYAVLGKEASDALDHAKSYTYYGKAYELAQKLYGDEHHKTVEILDQYRMSGEWSELMPEVELQALREKCYYEVIATYEMEQKEEARYYYEPWRDAARSYENIGNQDKVLMCLHRARELAKEDLQAFIWVEKDLKQHHKNTAQYTAMEESIRVLISAQYEVLQKQEGMYYYDWQTMGELLEELGQVKTYLEQYEGAMYYYKLAIDTYEEVEKLEEEQIEKEALIQWMNKVIHQEEQVVDIGNWEPRQYSHYEDTVLKILERLEEVALKCEQLERIKEIKEKTTRIKSRYFEV